MFFPNKTKINTGTLGKSSHNCLWRFGVKLRHSIHQGQIWVKAKFWVKVTFWVKVVVKVNVCVVPSGLARWSMSGCVVASGFYGFNVNVSVDVSVDSADGASSGLIR